VSTSTTEFSKLSQMFITRAEKHYFLISYHNKKYNLKIYIILSVVLDIG